MDTGLRTVLLIAVLAGLAAPFTALSQTLGVEAEDFTVARDKGGITIQSVPGSSCSNGYLLVGLDVAGEWVEYNVSVNDFGWYSFRINCRGIFNQAYALRLVFTPVGSDETESVDFTFTGNGYG